MQQLSQLGGFALSGVWATRQHLFAAALGPSDAQLLVYNLADPTNPTVLGRLTGASDALHVALDGSRAYLALGGAGTSGQEGGLLIADVSNPANPSRLGEYRFTAGYAATSALVGTHALVGAFRFGATLTGELHVVNVANPALPELVRLLNVEARDIAVAGTRAYLASGEAGLRVLDVSDPANPQALGVFDTPGAVSGVAVIGNTAFLADAATAPGSAGGLRIVDVTNPAQPQAVGAFTEAGFLASDVVLSDNFAYLAGFSPTLGRAQVWVLDATNPATPQRVQVLDGVGAPLFAQNGRLFTQGGIGGFTLWDISNPAFPTLRGESVPPVPLDVAQTDSLLYTAEGAQGVQVFSLADPTAPVALGRWATPGVSASRVAAAGNHAFVSAGGAGMRVLDVSNPRQPREVGTYPAPLGGAVTHVAVDGNQAFLSHSGGWQILDISTPANPTQVGELSLGVIVASDVVRPHAFLIGSRLRVVDISNPASPRIVGQLNLPGTPRALDAVGTLVAVAVGEAGLVLVDVADPANPRLLATVDTPGNAQGVSILGNLAFVADGFGAGVRVIDLTDLNRPSEVAFFSGIDARAVAATNPVYVAGELDGLLTLRSLIGVVSAPIVSNIVPAQSLNFGTLNARISGLNFQAGGSVTLQRNGQPNIVGTNVVVESNRSLTADFDLTDRAAGAWDVVVRNPDGQEGRLAGAFTIIAAVPRLTRVTPNTALAFGTVNFDIVGERFLTGASVRLTRSGQPDIAATTTNVLRETQIRAAFDLTGAALGVWDMVVRNPNGQEGRLASAVTLRRSQPIIAEVNPPNAINFGSVELTFTGSEFLPGGSVTLQRNGEADILPTRLTRESDTRLRATFDLTGRSPGVWNVVVTNEDGGSGQNSFEIQKSSPVIREFTPDSATVLNETVEVVIRGGRFFSGSRVRLVGGGPPLEAQNVVVSADGTQINALFRTFGAPGGTYALEVDNPLTNKALNGPFRLREPRLRVSVAPPPSIRIGRREQIFVTASNLSDLRQDVQIKFSLPTEDTGGQRFVVRFRLVNLAGQELARGVYNGIPVLLTLKPGLGPFETHRWILEVQASPAPNPNPLRPPQEVKRVPILLVGIVAAGLFYAGTLVLDAACEIAIKHNLQLQAAINGVDIDPDFLNKLTGDEQNRLHQLLQNIFGETADVAKDQLIDKIKDVLADNSKFIKLITENKLDEIASEIPDAIEVVRGEKTPFEYLAEKLQDKLGDIITSDGLSATAGFILAKASLNLFLNAAKDCLKKNEELSRLLDNSSSFQQLRPPITRAVDPNAKGVSAGINGFIAADETIQYLVQFENLPTATAAAQEVVITDVLDPNLDLSSLTFTQAGFGEHQVVLPPDARTINADVDLRPARNLVVQVRGAVDPTTRTMTVTFRGIDPTTGDLHRDGFLPPDQNPPEGQGFVAFSVKPLPQTPSGTPIRNRATIVFDVEAPLQTNEVTVTLDAVAPQSAVRPLLSVVPSPLFTVQWDAGDDASGVQDVQLWFSDNGSEFRLLDTFPPDVTSVQFTGKFGHTYRFYTAARDKVGHEEAHPTTPDATTTVGAPPPLGAGLRIVSLPVKSEIADPKQVFNFDGNRWARWNPQANGGQGAYAMYPDPFTLFTDPEQVLGKGFWAFLPAPTAPNARGDLPAEGSQVVIPFKPGWNLLGNPLLTDLIWTSLRVRVDDQERSLREAQAAGWVEEYGWGFEPEDASASRGRYVLLDDPGRVSVARGVVRPFEGFWFFARREGALVVTAPPLAQRPLNASGETLRNRRGWMTELSLSAGGVPVGSVFVGATGDGKTARLLQPPPAPTGTKNVRISLVGEESRPSRHDRTHDGIAGYPTARLAAVLNGEATRGEWTVRVESDAPLNEELTLAWERLGTLPKHLDFTLVDLSTGKRQYMRTTKGYTFRLDAGETVRQFKVVAEPRSNAPLQVRHLRAQALGDRAGVQVGFLLTRPAVTQIELLSPTGKRVAVLESGQARSAGLQSVVWNGRLQSGALLPRGLYLLRLRARDNEGRAVQAAGTIVVR